MRVVVINGSPETGKDKFVKIVKSISQYRVKNISSVDKVKQIAEITMGWDGKKDSKSRLFLSELKSAWTKFNNGPINYIIDKINIDIRYCNTKNKDINNNIYFLHIREPKEIKKIKEYYQDECVTLLLKKDSNIQLSNDSDKYVENYKYDHIIYNNGNIEELTENCKNFINKII